MSRMKTKYIDEIVPGLMSKSGCHNRFEVPRLRKIVINAGFGRESDNKKIAEGVVRGLAAITGQRPILTRARKSIAAFKLRKGVQIGCKVTLRGEMMYEFLDRFINVALPRIRDFRGVSPDSFDGRGNYTLGVVEQSIFPELSRHEKDETIFGMDVTIVTTAKADEQAFKLLGLFGMPFRIKPQERGSDG